MSAPAFKASLTSRSALASSDERLITEISALVNSLTGIQLGEKQRSMVSSRVKKRISMLGLKSELEYATYLKEHPESESAHLVSLLTTHHTYFFREFAHFEHLEKTALPALVAEKRKTGQKKITLWSAACSTGQEVYSLAMFVDHYFAKNAPDFTYEILGTDVDPASVKTGQNGVYRSKEIQEVPMQFLARHWAKGTGDIAAFVKAKASIKAHCKFEPMNLLSASGSATKQKFDIIFCRNVFIYFNSEQIKSITAMLLKSLGEHGALYLGVSESLNGLGLPCQIIGPSIYSHPKTATAPESVAPKNLRVVPLAAAAPKVERPLRVLCVDDSPSILALLKKILTADAGFEIVGTAGSGLEIAAKLKSLQVDLVTLDIHMPGQTGIDYLKTSYSKGHPPVVMISSVSREDASLPLECLKAGAIDYIEKPSLSNLVTQTDEIRMKLKYAAKTAQTNEGLDLVKSLSKTDAPIQNLDGKLRVVFGNLIDRERIASFLADLKGRQPATVILTESTGSALDALSEFVASKTSKTPLRDDLRQPRLKSDAFYVSDASAFFASGIAQGKTLSVLVFGDLSISTGKKLAGLKPAQLILEDRSSKQNENGLRSIASEIIPSTSFAYTSIEFFKRSAK